MPVSQPLALRNLKDTVTVLTPNFSDSKVYLEFQAAGDPSGGDVQYISEELAASPACVKAIMHGILALEDDAMSPDVAQAFQAQMRVAKQQRERAEAQVAQTIDRPENRDIVGETCVGPGDREGALCGASVPRQEKAMADLAPLCARHGHLAAQYTRVEDNSYSPDGEKRKTGYKWFRTRIEAREREQG